MQTQTKSGIMRFLGKIIDKKATTRAVITSTKEQALSILDTAPHMIIIDQSNILESFKKAIIYKEAFAKDVILLGKWSRIIVSHTTTLDSIIKQHFEMQVDEYDQFINRLSDQYALLPSIEEITEQYTLPTGSVSLTNGIYYAEAESDKEIEAMLQDLIHLSIHNSRCSVMISCNGYIIDIADFVERHDADVDLVYRSIIDGYMLQLLAQQRNIHN